MREVLSTDILVEFNSERLNWGSAKGTARVGCPLSHGDEIPFLCRNTITVVSCLFITKHFERLVLAGIEVFSRNLSVCRT